MPNSIHNQLAQNFNTNQFKNTLNCLLEGFHDNFPPDGWNPVLYSKTNRDTGVLISFIDNLNCPKISHIELIEFFNRFCSPTSVINTLQFLLNHNNDKGYFSMQANEDIKNLVCLIESVNAQKGKEVYDA